MSEGCDLTVVIPCLNEADTLATCIRKAQIGIRSANQSGEIVVADNGSTDGSPEIAEREGSRVVHVKMISARAARRLLGAGGFSEAFLARLPCGAQYQVLAAKPIDAA
jgi:glycosyltransferase involved in cell wall biosynthesis